MSELKVSENVSLAAKEDIFELHTKIKSFQEGKEDEEKFRSFRLSRGVYGQRQEGVQMIRIKLPYGRVSADQLTRIADVADKYATDKNHVTTRQDIQIHYVKLADSPALWAELEDAGITLKEACGNTVRNVTGSAISGVDPNEPFDVTPYAHAFFEYFLRNPICQDMGRKFKVSFSSSEDDSAFAFMHDIGFIPVVKNGEKGFKAMIGGGLGAQPMKAFDTFDFIPLDEIIPLAESIIRVFDRHGERASRGKARMKFLIKKIGIDAFLELVQDQKKAIINKKFEINTSNFKETAPADRTDFPSETPSDEAKYNEWLRTNVFEQKQKGFFGVNIRVKLGDLKNNTSRALADLVREGYAADDIRLTVIQGYFLRFVRENALVSLFNRLDKLGLAEPGHGTTVDIVACPGTDTCNLGIASSTGMALELERLIETEYRELIFNNDIKIKISGCMNACGQHNIANVGFQGMSIKKGALVLPAMQVLLGGGFDKEGNSTMGDKIVKVPSKRVPEVFRAIMDDYDENSLDGEYYNNYYQRKLGDDKMYFFQLTKPFTTVPDDIPTDFFVDWGTEADYVKEVGVGECAGVVLDLVGTLINEAKERFDKATLTLEKGNWQDSIYHSYNTFVVGAKALLTGEGVSCNTQVKIIEDFDENFVAKGLLKNNNKTFIDTVLEIDKNEPSLEFAKTYYATAKNFVDQFDAIRKAQIEKNEAQEA